MIGSPPGAHGSHCLPTPFCSYNTPSPLPPEDPCTCCCLLPDTAGSSFHSQLTWRILQSPALTKLLETQPPAIAFVLLGLIVFMAL